MNDVLYLAWRYLAYHRFKTGVLVGSITLIVYLPFALNLLVSRSAAQLTARAEATPLLVGAKGSPLELVLSSLYFEADSPPPAPYAELRRIERSGLARVFPLHTRHRTRHSPIVGTSLEYFEFRRLRVRRGKLIGSLGDCVMGSTAAQLAQVEVGDSVMSASSNVFDLSGVYPLKMKVVGVLHPTGGPDDRAVFVDVKTAWVIEGLAHGHQDLSQPAAAEAVLRRESGRIIANASVKQYNEITPENVASFHFHGDMAEFPLSSIVAAPFDEKSSALLQGRYLGDDQAMQIVQPTRVMEKLLQTVLTVRRYVLLAMGLAGAATLASMILVFALSLQLRRREMETIMKIGGSRWRAASLIAAEVSSVLLAGAGLATLLALATSGLAATATRLLIQLA